MALIDGPPKKDAPPLWSLQGVLLAGQGRFAPTILSTWTKSDHTGASVELVDAYHAAGWAYLIRPNVFSVDTAEPVSTLYEPVKLVVILLDVSRADFAAWHREHCEYSCFMCHGNPPV